MNNAGFIFLKFVTAWKKMETFLKKYHNQQKKVLVFLVFSLQKVFCLVSNKIPAAKFENFPKENY
jgi:hypothetical protein